LDVDQSKPEIGQLSNSEVERTLDSNTNTKPYNKQMMLNILSYKRKLENHHS